MLLADRLPLDDAPLGYPYRSSYEVPGPPVATSVERDEVRAACIPASEGTATVEVPTPSGSPMPALPPSAATTNLNAGATADNRDDDDDNHHNNNNNEEDGGYESEDSMPRLETPNDSSDDEEAGGPAGWTEEEFVRAVRDIVFNRTV
uniref:High-affinity nickel-transport protein NixA n=1 Tax=Ganoderma boninense TaxID=34458 RepID=A0A5K1K570_9APHY|nr:High-affinity nickel-transport protein NixA [Ganoderma boninense]